MSPHTDSSEIFSENGRIRCGLVHSHVLLRQGMRRLLEDEPDIEVVSEAGNAAECLRKVHELQPDVLITDYEIFGVTHANAELLVARESSHTRIIFLNCPLVPNSPSLSSSHDRERSPLEQISAEDLIGMVRAVGLSRRTNALQTSSTDKPLRNPPLFGTKGPLTSREREVLKLLAEGKTVRAAATVLGLSIKTVDAHKFNLMRKLGIHNKAELVMWAIQRKVVKVPVNF